jgi:hypothetical protein
MAEPFFNRLKEYFTNVGSVLKGQADVASIFPNAIDVGTSRERIYAEILRLHVPQSCKVSFGGFLFDFEGNESKQIDLIVLNDTSPQFNFHNPDGKGKSFACINGCVAVASIKSTLDSTQLINALENIASLPDKVPLKEGMYNPLINITGWYEDWPYKVIYSSDGVSMATALQTINSFYKDNRDVPYNKRPNIIHVCGNYNIIRAGKNVMTRSGKAIEENSFHGQPDPSDSYALLYTILHIQEIVLASRQIYYKYGDLLDKLPM